MVWWSGEVRNSKTNTGIQISSQLLVSSYPSFCCHGALCRGVVVMCRCPFVVVICCCRGRRGRGRGRGRGHLSLSFVVVAVAVVCRCRGRL